MSNIIPPLLSSSPPPLNGTLEDDEDEFGDFTFATDLSYGCDVPSLPQKHNDENQSIPSNSHNVGGGNVDLNSETVEKDFQDRRKSNDSESNGIERFNSAKHGVDYNSTKINDNIENKYNSFQYFPDIPPDILPGDDDEDEYVENVHHFVDDSEDSQDLRSSTNTLQESDTLRPHERFDEEGLTEISSKDEPSMSTNIFEEAIPTAVCAGNDVDNLEKLLEANTKDSLLVNDTQECSQDENFELPNKQDVSTVNTETSTPEDLKTINYEDSSKSEDLQNIISSSSTTVNCEDANETSSEEHNEEPGSIVVDTDVWTEGQLPINPKSISLNDDDEFGDFENHTFEENPTSNFPAFTKEPEPLDTKSVLQVATEEEDEFGDFNDYSLQPEDPQLPPDELNIKQLTIDASNIPEQAKTVVLLMFPTNLPSTEDYKDWDFTNNDTTFTQLKDITDTFALQYQWNKSSSQNSLLKALGIDTRNILYGPRWNESMPRYAATLGFTPLEPVKSETVNPVVSTEPSTSSSQILAAESSQTSEIPSAQFDWDGSGLTNPLENSPGNTMLLDLEQLVASLDIQFSSPFPDKSSNSFSPPDLDDWEFWLRLTPKDAPVEGQGNETKIEELCSKISIETEVKHSKFDFPPVPLQTVPQLQADNESVKSLQLLEGPLEEVANVEGDFNDFTSFQSSSKSEENIKDNSVGWSAVNEIPLRETHISSPDPQSETPQLKPDKTSVFDDLSWLKSTIITPDLPGKTMTETISDNPGEKVNDFQMSKVLQNAGDEVQHSMVNDDDEFSDFQSTLPTSQPSLPLTTSEPLQPTTSILEPLQPSILQPVASTNISTVINWPDPGVTDDDLKHIELFYKPTTELPATKDKLCSEAPALEIGISLKSEQPKKSTSVDDDDWSDFVSNQVPQTSTTSQTVQPSPLKTVNKVKQPSRTSTPELQLCIPHLNQIQPPKKPVPVITQQGLQQTKLSSTVSSPVPLTLIQPSIQQSKTYPNLGQGSQNGFQPAFISDQFAAQFGQGLLTQKPVQAEYTLPLHNSAVQQPSHAKSSVSSNKQDDFDDEWSDFVSSQPVGLSAAPNGLHVSPPPRPNFDWNRPPQFTSWSTSVTPNIITNPVSFDTFQNYSGSVQSDLTKCKVSNRKNPNVVIQSKKNTIPSISAVPDMEFIAPKSRAWKK